jgi:hypothetical protein
MTTRLKGLTVAFAADIREDDAEAVIKAIRMIRGVLDVAPIECTPNDWIERQRVRDELSTKLWDVLHPKSS